MAEFDPKQRSSTSLFGSSSTAHSVQEVRLERQQASRARRKWLFSWLFPLLGILILAGGSLFAYLKWREHKAAAEEAARANVLDPMRGITVFGNEDATLKLEARVPDMLIAPRQIMTILHRAVGIKPYKVRLDVINLMQREEMEQASDSKFTIAINGSEEVECLDEAGVRQPLSLSELKNYTPEQLISAITLAYRDIYGDDDPAHPFHINMPAPPPQSKHKADEPIDLNVDKLR